MNNTQSNVTPIESRQPAPAGAKFTITAVIDGFPVQVEVEGAADKLRAMIDRLKAIGATPPQSAIRSPQSPACPEHGKAKASRKPGEFYCPTSLPDGGYCRWTGRA